MRIVADENIPLVEAFFSGFGEITRVAGRSMSAATVKDADVLLVRSVTKVNEALLSGSQVRFVGTCTIGTDHLDLDYLDANDISWSSAPGCNARGVIDYVLGSLMTLAEDAGVDLASRVYGVVGAGEVGGRLATVLKGLGWHVKVCDPPRARQEKGDFVDLEEVIQSCDVISVHTPLTTVGADATWHLLDEAKLSSLQPNTWLINAARGPVIDNQALLRVLQLREDLEAVLDVWEHEPLVNLDLAKRCKIATPHIAGYSLDGKQRGTEQIYRALCNCLQVPVIHRLEDFLPPQPLPHLTLAADADPKWVLPALSRLVYDPRRDDADFRRSLSPDPEVQRQHFDVLRKNYPVRREIPGLKVSLQGDSAELRKILTALGIE